MSPTPRPEHLVFTKPDLKPLDEPQIANIAGQVLNARAVKLKIASASAQAMWTKAQLAKPGMKAVITAAHKSCVTLFEKYVNLEKGLLGKMGMALKQAPVAAEQQKIIEQCRKEGEKLQAELRAEMTSVQNKIKKDMETFAGKLKFF